MYTDEHIVSSFTWKSSIDVHFSPCLSPERTVRVEHTLWREQQADAQESAVFITRWYGME